MPNTILEKTSLPAKAAPVAEKLSVFFRVPLQEQMLFAKRLAILLKAGVPIMSALEMMKKQTSSKAAKRVLEHLHKGVEHGQALHMRLAHFRKNFGDFAINIIRVGEISGTLHENLAYLAEELKKQRELRRKVVSALVYPIFIVLATLGITILLTVYVFPKILPILSSFKGQLPITTRMLIFISHTFATKGWIIFLALILLITGFMFAQNRWLKFRLWIDSMLLKIPVLGHLLQAYNVANFSRTLGILLKSDVRIVEATNITAKTCTNLVYYNALTELAQNVSRGEKLTLFFEKYAKIFPPMVGQMVMVGETTGKLSESLLYLGEIYENEVDELTKNLSTSIEPLLMIFMGIIVGFVAVSIITPIYSFTQNISPYK